MEGGENYAKGFVAGLKEFLKAMEKAEKKEGWVAGSGEFGPVDLRTRYGYNAEVLGLGKDIGHSEAGYSKSVNVSRGGSKILVEVKLPKVKEGGIDLDVAGNSLKIRAKTPGGEIQREISIGKSQKIKKIKKAEFKNGVLSIELIKKGKMEWMFKWLKLRR